MVFPHLFFFQVPNWLIPVVSPVENMSLGSKAKILCASSNEVSVDDEDLVRQARDILRANILFLENL